MRLIALTAVFLLAFCLASARAQQGPDDQYVAVYSMIQQADSLADGGQPREALAEYVAAQAELEKFATIYPEWGPNIITFRRHYLTDKIEEVTALLPPPVSTPAPPAPPTVARPEAVSPVINSDAGLAAQLNARLNDLHGQMQNLQADNTTLAAKLKEALTAQPAAIDPRELAAAQEKVRSLMKENDLLRVSLARPNSSAEATSLLGESNALNQAQLQLADLGRQLAAVKEHASELSEANQAMQAQVKTLLASREGVQALRDENALLKQQLAEAKTAANNSQAEDQLKAELKTAQSQLDALKEAARLSALDKAALEQKVQALELAAAHPTVTADQTEQETRLRNLEQERDDLRTQLAVAGKQLAAAHPAVVSDQTQNESRIRDLEQERDTLRTQLAAHSAAATDQADQESRIQSLEQERDALRAQLVVAVKSKADKQSRSKVTAQIGQLTEQVKTLQARLAVDEAQPVPYTEAELALFRQTVPAPAAAQNQSGHELPAGSAELVASAHTHFAAGEYDQAEADYEKVLRHDENNGLVLADLAAIELQQGHLSAAEKHITAAIAQSPNDSHNLAILGNLKFQQEKYDEALDILGRAAKLDPQNPEIENLLGVCLGHKGLRLQAETALRKALVLDPDYAAAHNNLAVVYISEEPPRAELARWHYLKALAAGQPHNPGLEKILAANGAAIPTQ